MLCVVCQLWSCGYQSIDLEVLLTTCCLEMLLHMPRSVNGPWHLILKYVACVLVRGSPPVGFVISSTDWCWYGNTDQELDLSFTDGINTWHAYIYWVLGFTLHAKNVFFTSFRPLHCHFEYRSYFSTITFVCLVFIYQSC